MLSSSKLKKLSKEHKMGANHLAGFVSRGALTQKKAASALRNWMKGLYKPKPRTEDIERIAGALGVEIKDISQWQSSYKYAPSSPRKIRLVTELISGRNVQDALDVLKFEHKRAARMVEQVLASAISNADEGEADVESLYVCQARVDGAGRRVGTKSWIAKDRGRAHPICKQASHIHITVTEE